ncbi:PAS domain S-box-containing protein [Desulfocicer vacuolatum DSM 3385]|uniref:histidine kinase n=1 Tax=Desulfocicer vacuolatum DSM 3385 TaxID=1121400 RepID=A0A1W2EF40_9BACT|nr:sensor histidine kinase [Desulfocicer vacuolatum]SMD08374.1 PAS domain S-box-containing protein [Desulfocicer vacuolatum DSM 3385]
MQSTYKELEKKIRALEKEIASVKLQNLELNKKSLIHETIFSNLPLFIMIIDFQGNVEDMSALLLKSTGLNLEKENPIKGGELLKCIHHQDNPEGCGFGPHCKTCEIRRTIQNTINTGESHYKVEAELISFDRIIGKRILLLSTALLKQSDKKIVVLIEDITEQKKFETALTEQTDFLNALIETISNPIFYKNSDGRYTGCNKSFENFTGMKRSDIIGKTVYEIGPKKLAHKYHQKDQQLFENPGTQHYEWKIGTPGGKIRDVIFDKATLHDVNGNVTGLVGVISDITERKHAEDLIRKLSQMLMQAQERERQMISCELHDSIAQNLSTLKLYFARILVDQPSLAEKLREQRADISQLIDQIIMDVRNLAYDLRPPSLDHLGLVHALEVFCEEFAAKNKIDVNFHAVGIDGITISPEMEINLYRLVHEALSNVQKHASATRVVIKFVGAYPHIILRIEDNGKGFDLKDRERSMINEKRMGIWSMKERANLLQGRMDIHSQLNRGTKIVIKLLLKDKKKWMGKNRL